MRIAVAMILAVCFALPAFAHSGGTNAQGCHTDRKTGAYHCH